MDVHKDASNNNWFTAITTWFGETFPLRYIPWGFIIFIGLGILTLFVLTILVFYPHLDQPRPFCATVHPFQKGAQKPNGTFPHLSDQEVVSYFGTRSFLPTWGIFIFTAGYLAKGLAYAFSQRRTHFFPSCSNTEKYGAILLFLIHMGVVLSFLLISIICGVSLREIKGHCSYSLLVCFEVLLGSWICVYLLSGIGTLIKACRLKPLKDDEESALAGVEKFTAALKEQAEAARMVTIELRELSVAAAAAAAPAAAAALVATPGNED